MQTASVFRTVARHRVMIVHVFTKCSLQFLLSLFATGWYSSHASWMGSASDWNVFNWRTSKESPTTNTTKNRQPVWKIANRGTLFFLSKKKISEHMEGDIDFLTGALPGENSIFASSTYWLHYDQTISESWQALFNIAHLIVATKVGVVHKYKYYTKYNYKYMSNNSVSNTCHRLLHFHISTLPQWATRLKSVF